MEDSPVGKQHRLHAFLSGKVQGVGMRATVTQLARQHVLAGWVRNLPDGRVELWCEGSGESLRVFLTELTGIMRSFIREMQEDWGDATGQYEDFEVRF